MSSKYFIAINPVSGNTDNSRKIRELKSYLESQQISFDLYFTTADRKADGLIREEFNSDYSHLIIAGGDGSLNDAINGMNDFSIPIGIVPLGSGNDFVKNLSIGKNFDYLLSNNIQKTDLWYCNDRLFHNGVGAGFDGQIIVNMKEQSTWFKGHAAYYYHVIKILSSYKERLLSYSVDGHPYEEKVLLILAANGTTFGGGFRLAPEAEINDGLLDICVIKEVSPVKRFLKLNKLKAGTHLSMVEVDYFKAQELRIESANIHGQIDGEYMGTPPYSIRAFEQKAKIMIP